MQSTFSLLFPNNRSTYLRTTGPWWDQESEVKQQSCGTGDSARYRLILHHRPQTTVADAQRVRTFAAMLTEVIALLSLARAEVIVVKAFHHGHAVILTCQRSEAEKYRDQLVEAYHLDVTVETAEK